MNSPKSSQRLIANEIKIVQHGNHEKERNDAICCPYLLMKCGVITPCVAPELFVTIREFHGVNVQIKLFQFREDQIKNCDQENVAEVPHDSAGEASYDDVESEEVAVGPNHEELWDNASSERLEPCLVEMETERCLLVIFNFR